MVQKSYKKTATQLKFRFIAFRKMIANLLKGAVEIKLLLIHIVAAQIFLFWAKNGGLTD